jgi:hypothetical protein
MPNSAVNSQAENALVQSEGAHVPNARETHIA